MHLINYQTIAVYLIFFKTIYDNLKYDSFYDDAVRKDNAFVSDIHEV